MEFGLRRTAPPAQEVITLEMAKLQTRIDGSDEDVLLKGYLTVAREDVEDYVLRALTPQEWTLTLDGFPPHHRRFHHAPYVHRFEIEQIHRLYHHHEILLPRPPCISITSITYLDTTGAEQTLDPSTYRLDNNSEPARLTPAFGQYWPETAHLPGSVKIVYQAGYETTPMKYIQAILLTFSSLYLNRDNDPAKTSSRAAVQVPTPVENLIGKDRITPTVYD
jgi:uncharacterized phiE125 gp8 family phage protein